MAVPIAAISAKDNANEIHPNLRAVHHSAHFPVAANSFRGLCANSSTVVTRRFHSEPFGYDCNWDVSPAIRLCRPGSLVHLEKLIVMCM